MLDELRSINFLCEKHMEHLRLIRKSCGVSQDEKMSIEEQEKYLLIGRSSENIVHLEFKNGYELLLLLYSNPKSKITVFNYDKEACVIHSLQYLQNRFPGRLEIAIK